MQNYYMEGHRDFEEKNKHFEEKNLQSSSSLKTVLDIKVTFLMTACMFMQR